MLPLLLLTTALAHLASSVPAPLVPRDKLLPRQNLSPTRNDLVDGLCAPISIVFARGTLELGNVGSLAGPPFFAALTDIVGASTLTVQGVDYGATVLGYLEGGDPTGATEAAKMVDLAVSQCPGTKIVLGGYSQGAQVIHLAAKQLSAATASQVAAVVFFGDPDDGQALQNIAADETDTYCFDTDLICDGLPIVLPAHLSYSIDAVPAAQFVAATVQV